MEKKITNVVVVGVGGQGILLTSDIIAEVAFREGHDVKKSEVHGMAQRGGSVISEVRFGEKVFSPLVKKGEADFLLALEKLEALRFHSYLKEEGTLIVNDLEIPPLGVSLGKEEYPRDIFSILEKKNSEFIRIDGLALAEKAGNSKTVNVVLLGTLSSFLPFSFSSWRKVIEERVPSRTVEYNLEAFKLGREWNQASLTR